MPRPHRPHGKASAKPFRRPAQQPQRPEGTRSPIRSERPRHPGGLWLYGLHPVRAALANPKRKILKAVLTERAAAEIGTRLLGRVRHEIVTLDEIGRLLPQGSVHQGAALQCEKLPKLALEDALSPARDGKRQIVLV